MFFGLLYLPLLLHLFDNVIRPNDLAINIIDDDRCVQVIFRLFLGTVLFIVHFVVSIIFPRFSLGFVPGLVVLLGKAAFEINLIVNETVFVHFGRIPC